MMLPHEKHIVSFPDVENEALVPAATWWSCPGDSQPKDTLTHDYPTISSRQVACLAPPPPPPTRMELYGCCGDTKVKVSGAIHENDSGMHASLVVLIPRGPEGDALSSCLGFDAYKGYDDCKDEATGAIPVEQIVELHRTGPQDETYSTMTEIAVGKYVMFMFGNAHGIIPVSDQPYTTSGSDVKFLEVTPDQTEFNVDFWLSPQ